MNKKTNIIAKIKELFAEVKMAKDYTAATGEIIRAYGEGLAVGDEVAEIAAEKESPLPDGSYLLDNGKSIVVEAGKIKEVNEVRSEDETNPVAMEETEMAEYKNEIESKLVDGTEVKILTKGEALSVGDEILVKQGEEYVKAPAGEHELEGGLVVEVNDEGFIDELKTKEVEEVDEAENEEMKTMFEAVSTIKSMVDELKETINSLKTENTELKERFNKFAAEPSADTITKTKENVVKLTSKDDKLRFFGKK